MPRLIVWDLRIDWTLDGSYVDESARLLSASGSVRFAAPESSISSPRGTVDRCTLTLNNSDGRYSPLNTSGALYDDIQFGNAYHAPMYLRVSVDGGSNYDRVFTGVIKIPREGPPYPGVAATVEIDCRSRDEILLNKRISTLWTVFRGNHENGSTEREMIAQFLEDAGLSSSDYTLDPGLFVIPWAWLDDESAIEDIWMMAAACGGRFYVDPDGEFRYENMTHWLLSPHTTSQETLTAADYGQMDGPTYDDRELYSAVTAVASPRDVLESGTIWAADAVVVIPANSTKTITAKLRQPAYAYGAISYTAATGGGRNLDSDISIAVTYYAQRLVLAITNANTTHAANLLALTITGSPVSGGPTVEETRTSTADFWDDFATLRPGRTRLLQGNPYLQTVAQAGALASFLRDRYQMPRLSYRLRNVPGNPGRRLGDRITVGNASAMSANRAALITSIDFRLSNRGFVQDLELFDAGSVADGNGLYQYDAYFIIGTHEYGDGTNPDSEPIFY